MWLLISTFFQPLFIFYGVASTLICIFFFSKMLKIAEIEGPIYKVKFLSFKFIGYIGWLFKEIILSSFKVSVEMWKPNPNVKPELKWIKHNLEKDGSVATYANSITLTPGTVSMYASDKEILVHALHSDGIKDLEKGEMNKRIKDSLEG